jgi:flagellar motor switch protein FliM
LPTSNKQFDNFCNRHERCAVQKSDGAVEIRSVARPANAAVLIRLRIDMEDRGGRLELLLPYATLEPIRELLLQMFMGEKFGRDAIWESHLATELWSTHIELEAVLEEHFLTIGEVMNLEVGKTMMLNCTPDTTVQLNCGGVPLLRGKMGRVGKNVSIHITNALPGGGT